MKRNKVLILAASLPALGFVCGVVLACFGPNSLAPSSRSAAQDEGYRNMQKIEMKAPTVSPVMTGHPVGGIGGGGGGHSY